MFGNTAEKLNNEQFETTIDDKEVFIKEMICGMSDTLDARTLKKFELKLRTALHGLTISRECTALATELDDNAHIFQVFYSNKKLENLSEKSLIQYITTTKKMLDYLNKNYKNITTDDVKYYLAMYQQQNKVSTNTLVNMKRFISAFFGWAHEEGYIRKNPCSSIRNMKVIQKKKEFLTEEEKELMRDSCKTPRETALVDFLLSTGVRVSELVALNQENVDYINETVTVYASKSRQFRTVYLNAKAKKHLADYLNERTDSNPALFVGERQPYNRLDKGGVQYIIRNISKRAGIKKHCSVHIFRKTLATTLARNGCRLEYISAILGHAETSTTEKYYLSTDEMEKKASFIKYAA